MYTEGTTTRDRILEGAAKALGERGIDATTVQHILDEAGVSRRTYYQYFRSKDDLLRALYDDAVEDLVQRLGTAIVEAEGPKERVLDAIDAYLVFAQEGGALVSAMQAEAARPGSLLAAERTRALDALTGAIGQAVASYRGVRVDPLVFRALIIAIEGLVVDQAGDAGLTDADCARLHGVLGGIFVNVLAGVEYLPVATPA